MNEQRFALKLNQISTLWTVVENAHQGSAIAQNAAQGELLDRYRVAAYRYLLRLVDGDADAADELFQEFAVRLVRGDFQNATPSRGRFRNLVRTVLINMARNYRKQQTRDRRFGRDQPVAIQQVCAEHGPDQEFLTHWRTVLLDCVWEEIGRRQLRGGPPFYQVLRFNCDQPEVTAAEIAERLTTQLKPDRPFTEAGIRKILQRARALFAELLVEEVDRSLQTSSLEEVEEELGELGFLSYCHKALESRRADSSA
jgi:RNA polymerase sigma-70 factor (ECF subfamily)